MARKSNWVPLTFYEYNGTVYLVLARKNLRTGMIYFRTKRMSGFLTCCHNQPKLDINEQFAWVRKQSS